MADNGGAQKSLGGLYVDLGLKGLGNMIKGLNGVSANFLLTKNAIQQATKPLADMSKQAGQSVVAFDKINAVTGISVERLQEISQFTKLSNVDFNQYVGQLQKMQQAFIGIKMGNSSMLQGLSMLGIDARQFDYKNPEKALDIIQKKIEQLDEATGAYALSLLGLDANLMYAFSHINKEIPEIYQNTEKQNEALREQISKWNELDVGVKALSDKFIASAPMQTGLTFLVNLTKDWIGIIDDTDGVWTNFKENIKDTYQPLIKIFDILTKIVQKLHIIDLFKKDQEITAEHPFLNTVPGIGKPLAWALHAYEQNKTSTSTYNIPMDDKTIDKIDKFRQIDPNLITKYNASTNSYTVTVHQNITGTDSQDIANKSVSGIQKELNEVRNNNGVNR